MSQNAADSALTPVFRHIAGVLPAWRPSVIFDVGANVGQSCTAYATMFPDATIHAFEPVARSFAALQQHIAPFPNITAHPLALSCRAGKVLMSSVGTATGNRILDPGVDHRQARPVRIAPGAAVAARLGVEAISFLKIDTEGHDLDVVLGFAPMLGAVDFVQVEAAMNPYNRTHVPFRILEDTLRHFGFLLFNIYEARLETRLGGRPVLRRTNPVFIHSRLVDTTGIS